MWKKAFVLVVLSLLLLLLCACGSKENSVVGEWHFQKDLSTGTYLELTNTWNEADFLKFDEGMTFSVYADGTWKLSSERREKSGTYSIGHDGTAISITEMSDKYKPAIEFVDLSFDGNKMVLTSDGKKLVFSK